MTLQELISHLESFTAFLLKEHKVQKIGKNLHLDDHVLNKHSYINFLVKYFDTQFPSKNPNTGDSIGLKFLKLNHLESEKVEATLFKVKASIEKHLLTEKQSLKNEKAKVEQIDLPQGFTAKEIDVSKFFLAINIRATKDDDEYMVVSRSNGEIDRVTTSKYVLSMANKDQTTQLISPLNMPSVATFFNPKLFKRYPRAIKVTPETKMELMRDETLNMEIRGIKALDYFTLYNTYDPAKYLDLEVSGDPHPLYFEYMNTFFPDTTDRKAVEQWMADTLRTRCEVALALLTEVRGNGKTIFFDLLKSLHGKYNATTTDYDSIKSPYNAALDGKTLVIFDETPLSYSTVEKLKTWCNPSLTIHKKFCHDREIVNFTSFCVASNHIRDLTLEPNERRILLPATNRLKLDEVMDSKKLDLLVDIIRNHDRSYYTVTDIQPTNPIDYSAEHKKIYNYLMKTYPEIVYFKDTKYKGSKFFEVCKENAHEFIKFIIEKIEENPEKELDFHSLSDDYNYKYEQEGRKVKSNDKKDGKALNISRVQSFFNDYKPNGKPFVEIITSTGSRNKKVYTFKKALV